MTSLDENDAAADVSEMGRGLYIALIGTDGCGKTTVARGVIKLLTDRGYEVEYVRWRDVAAQSAREDFPYLSLRQLLVEGWRALYGGATDAASLAVQGGPLSYEDFTGAKLHDASPAYPVGVHRSGIVASAIIEMAANILMQAEIVNRYLSEGKIVIADSFGYKNVVKVLRVASDVPHDDVSNDFVARAADFIADAYSSTFLQPDIGVMLRVEPEECYRRIAAGRDSVVPMEDLGFAGRSGRSAFIELQGALLEEYQKMATSWGWHIADIGEASPAEALDVVSGIILSDISARRGMNP